MTLEDLLQSIAFNSMNKQKEILNAVAENWMGKYEQVDDVCIIGIKAS